jgi:hypothetical protein
MVHSRRVHQKYSFVPSEKLPTLDGLDVVAVTGEIYGGVMVNLKTKESWIMMKLRKLEIKKMMGNLVWMRTIEMRANLTMLRIYI